MVYLRTLVLAAVVAALSLVAASPAAAHRSPAGCTANGLTLDLQPSTPIARTGDDITFTPSYGNDDPGACDVTDATVTVWRPSPDGTPKAGGSTVVASNVDLLAGAALKALPALPYTVALDDGIFRSPATIEIVGTLHDSPSDGVGTVSRSADVVISRPRVRLSVTPTPASGFAPLSVGYAYLASNDSPVDADPGAEQPGVVGAQVTDDRCAPVTLQGGDANADGVLAQGETWSYGCTSVFGIGTFVDTATFGGTNLLDGRPWPTATADGIVTATAAPPASPGPTPPDEWPGLGTLSLSPASFRAARSGPSVAARKPSVGTTVSVTVSEAASVRFTVRLGLPGRRVAGRCLKPRPQNRHGRPCTRLPRVKGSFVVEAGVGKTTFRFSGRLRGRRLAPGRYRLTGVATDSAGQRSRVVRKPFRILTRP